MKLLNRIEVPKIALIICISVTAQDAGSDFVKVNERKEWGFSISPYAWLAGQATDVGGEKLRQSFNDNVDYALQISEPR